VFKFKYIKQKKQNTSLYRTAIIHVKAVTCFSYTYVAIITQLCSIVFYSFSYSRSCIQPDDDYVCIAETRSCLYCNPTSFLYIRSEKSTVVPTTNVKPRY
jgi:hypothetical protein